MTPEQMLAAKGTVLPLFDFHCPACAADVELLLRTGQTPSCPQCGATDLVKRVSLTAPQGKLKGLAKAARAQARREGHLSNF